MADGLTSATGGHRWSTTALCYGVPIAIVLTALFLVWQSSSDSAKAKERVQAAESEKAAFINRHHPEWYDVDLHGDANYVTYKVVSRKTGAIGLCISQAAQHHGRWIVNTTKTCTKIGQAKLGHKPKKRTQPNPLAWLTPDAEAA